MTDAETTAISRMKCREIMTKNVKTATREMSLREVASMIRDGDMGAVPVVDNGKLIGIVTDRDIVVRVVAEGKTADSPISEAMTTELFTVAPDDFVFEAIRLMGDKQVRRIPVVGRRRLARRHYRNGRRRVGDGRRTRDRRNARRDLKRKRILE